MEYGSFVAGKLGTVPATGITSGFSVPGSLFPHQSALTAWALRRGRAAIFADTGLGKSRMQLAWADQVARYGKLPVLILAPLAVAEQTVAEGGELGIEVKHCRDGSEAPGNRIVITNYDRLHRFDPSMFGGVVLDESSCIKHHNTKTLQTLLEAFKQTRFKLCATATPAPNDWTELGTHAEFLGVCSRTEMLAEFFTHDGGDTSVWRLKGHARHIFWQWVSQWGAMVRRPSDLGFDDAMYNLPPLHMHEHTVRTEVPFDGQLFASEAQGLSERRSARRMSLEDRVADCAAVVKGEWAILAAHQENDDAVEARICEGPQGEGEFGPDLQSEEECTEQQGQSCQGGVHEGVLRCEPGEIQTGSIAERRQECSEAGAVCGIANCQGCGSGCCKSVAGRQPIEAQESEVEAVWHRTVGLQLTDDQSMRALCDMRVQRPVKAEHVSGGRSLPCYGKGSGAAVHGVQSGSREVQGREITSSIGDRVPRQAWLIWCELNDEQDALEREFGNLAFSVRGSDTSEEKERAISRWVAGDRPVMISKPSIMGWGLNFQHAARMAFVGVTDSFESYYQAARRCWRFGQKRDVHVHIFASSAEGAVVANLKRKERDAIMMAEMLGAETRDAVMQSVTGTTRQTNVYSAGKQVAAPAWL